MAAPLIIEKYVWRGKCTTRETSSRTMALETVVAIGNAWYRLYFFAFVRTRWSRVPMSWRYTVDEEHFWIYFRPIERFRPSTQTDLSRSGGEARKRGRGRERDGTRRVDASRSEREEQSWAREIRRTEAEEARENLERCFESREKTERINNNIINEVYQLNGWMYLYIEMSFYSLINLKRYNG